MCRHSVRVRVANAAFLGFEPKLHVMTHGRPDYEANENLCCDATAWNFHKAHITARR